MVEARKSISKILKYNNISASQKEHFFTNRSIFKIDWNEASINIFDLYNKELKSLLISEKINIYPSLGSPILKEKLSKYTNLSTENIEVFNGSDNALESLCKVYISNKDPIAVVSPTYTNIESFASIYGASINRLIMPDPFRKNIKFLHDSLKSKDYKLFYLANPNNPTGVNYGSSEIESLVSSFQSTLFIIDEAYFEFAGTTCSELVNQYNNIVVTRSFSKAFGLAGIRLGYTLSCEEIRHNLFKVINQKDVNRICQIISEFALENRGYVQDYVNEVNKEKIIFSNFISSLGFECRYGEGNFVLVKVRNPSNFISFCEKKKVYIRNRSTQPGLEGYVRFTICDSLLMEKLMIIMKQMDLSDFKL